MQESLTQRCFDLGPATCSEDLEFLRNLAPAIRLRALVLREFEHILDLVERLGVKVGEHIGEVVDFAQADLESLCRVAQEGTERAERLAGGGVLPKLERREQDRSERVRAEPFPGRDRLVREQGCLQRFGEGFDFVAKDRDRAAQGERESLVFLALEVVRGQDLSDPVLRTADSGGEGEHARVQAAECRQSSLFENGRGQRRADPSRKQQGTNQVIVGDGRKHDAKERDD